MGISKEIDDTMIAIHVTTLVFIENEFRIAIKSLLSLPK